MVSSLYFVGNFAGAMIGGPLADAWGRRRVALYGALANALALGE
jgi:MFS family permease